MRYNSWLALSALVGLLLATSSDSFAQRGGRAGAVGGARGGYVAGPYGGGGGGIRHAGGAIGPGGGTVTGSSGRGSYTTPGGTTIQAGGAGVKGTGPGGVTAGRGVGGVQVTTPGGQTHTKVGTVGGVSGPGGRAAVGGSSLGVSTGPRGTAVTGSRGGAALGPGGAVVGGSRVGVGVGHGGTAVNPYGLSRYTTVRGGAVVGHRTTYVGASALRTQGVYVRRSFVHYNCFTPAWYRTHVGAWRPVAWTAAAFWTGVAWATVANTCGYPAQPVVYDYGTTVVYEDNRVYYNGDPVASAAEYTEQAAAIAVKGEEAKVSDKEEWVSLGVFGMVQGDDKDANNVFQLAVNKDGIIRGNYYDALTDTTLPVAGAVDRKTQRAAWTVGDRKETVYETGIGNLTEAETTMLVHFGKDRTQQWTLVRLELPAENK